MFQWTVQGHRANKWQIQNLKPQLCLSKPTAVLTMQYNWRPTLDTINRRTKVIVVSSCCVYLYIWLILYIARFNWSQFFKAGLIQKQ